MKFSTLNCPYILDYLPSEPEVIWPGLIQGTVAALVGDSAIGKTFFALEAAMAVGGGLNADLLGLNPTKKRRVAYFSTDETEDEINRRVFNIGANFELQTKVWAGDAVDIHKIEKFDVLIESDRQAVIKIMKDDEISLAIFDSFYGIHKESEYDSVAMIKISKALTEIAYATNASILVVMTSGNSSAKGTKNFLDRVRYVAHLKEDKNTNQIIFETKKCNNAVCSQKLNLKRDFGGVLLAQTEVAQSNTNKHEKREQNYAYL